MTDFYNPATLNGPQAVPREAGQLTLIPSRFNFATASYRPAAIVATDRILIGIVPAGCKLVEHLCRIAIPALDSNGSPTGDYSVGTAAAAASLAAAGAAETARTLTVANILVPGNIGSREVDTPIYATFTNNIATVPSTGTIVADLVVRAYDTSIDG
jgi:hypothetical protein